MNIEKIETEEQYQLVIKEIDTLLNSKAGTPEYEELQRLTDLVEDYEDGLCS